MNYTITCSEKQLKTISHACEILARLQCGHISAALELCRDENGEQWCLSWEDIQAVEKIVKPLLGLNVGQHYGVNKFDSSDISWDIYQVLRHKIWQDRKDEKLNHTVDAYPAMKFGSEELINVEIKNN